MFADFRSLVEGPSQPVISGSLNKTLDALTSTSAVQVIIKGQLNKTLDSIILSSAVEGLVKGTVNATLAPLTLSSTGGKVLIRGTLDKTLDSIILSSAAEGLVKGSLNVILGPLTLSASGTVPHVADRNGSLVKTLDALLLNAVGAVSGAGGIVAGSPEDITMRQHHYD